MLKTKISGPRAMQNQSTAHDARKSAQVLPFRRKAPAKPMAIVSEPALPPQAYNVKDDFARYDAERDEPFNERQRMLMNLIGVGIVVLLISFGVWIADTIQVSVKVQDCALQGRTNGAPIEVLSQR
jgi:hypothetical protein